MGIFGAGKSECATEQLKNGCNCLGTVVEWKDQTAELAVRAVELALVAENARIKHARDNCSTNVMIADNAGQIICTNKSICQSGPR